VKSVVDGVLRLAGEAEQAADLGEGQADQADQAVRGGRDG
jgi:hypothetical protein